MVKLRLLALLSITLLLASCQVFDGGDDDSSDSSNVLWDSDPSAIIFRAEVAGGEFDDAFYRHNDVPLCTIYGDGKIVWTTETGSGVEVLFDYLTTEHIAIFVKYMVEQRGFYTFSAGADYEMGAIPPVTERISLNIYNDQGVTFPHVADSFGGMDYVVFEEIVSDCQHLSSTPIIFEPNAGWISAEATNYDSNAPFLVWDKGITDLAELSVTGERRWIEGRAARVLWRFIRTNSSDLQFGQDDGLFYIALEVPSVTRFSPPPPE
jgi:hypothetical protein